MPVPLQPGNTPVFTVTPTFSGTAFALTAANASVASSDPVNFPVELVASDPTGKSFQATIPSTLKEPKNVTFIWAYRNGDGKFATVTGAVLLEPTLVNEVVGGTFVQTT